MGDSWQFRTYYKISRLYSQFWQHPVSLIKYRTSFAICIHSLRLSRRSQPPLFTQMIEDYFVYTSNTSFLAEYLPLAEKELAWWRSNRTVTVHDVNGVGRTLYQYKAASNCPRPENFLEDYQNGIQSGENTEFYWSSTASACESGLDFSSRWFYENGSNSSMPGICG